MDQGFGGSVLRCSRTEILAYRNTETPKHRSTETRTKLSHKKRHHAKRLPAAGDGKKRGCFLFLVSAVIVFLFILLPFWLLYKRSVKPPASEAFGPPPASAAPAIDPDPDPDPDRERRHQFAPVSPDADENEKPVRFK